MALYHAYSQTVGDGTATSVVRPSDWNSGHNQFVTLAGNTVGASTISGTNIVYQGGNNVTLSGTGATIIVSGANTSQLAGQGTTLNLTNLNGTLNVGSNGVALSLNNPDNHFVAWELEGANTAGTTATTLTTTGAFYLSGGNNITLSGNSNTIVIQGAAGGAGSTNDGWAPYADLQMVAGQQGQGTLFFEPEHSPNFFQDRIGIPIAYTNATNSTGSVTLSYYVGLYTQNVSTLSLASSTSFSSALTFSGTVGSYSLFSGMRLLTFPWSLTVSAQELYIGQISRSTTGGANASLSQMLVTNINSNFVGFFGASHNTTQQFTQGQGVYTATTSAFPNSVAFSQIRGSDSNNFRAPAIRFINGTV